MKKLKLTFTIAVIFIMTITGSLKASCLDYCKLIQYSISHNEAVITGFTGEPEILDLPSVIDGKPVTEIRENAFYKCETLKKISIPKSVSLIGHHAFYGCKSLESVEINGNIQQLPEGIFYGCENLESVDLNIQPSALGSYAFYGCRSLSEFTVPSSVINIGGYCFGECLRLNKVTLNSSLKNIEEYAFYNCANLEKINLPETLLSIGQQAIGYSKNGRSETITITGSTNSIAENYAVTNEIKFRSRVRYINPDKISDNFISQFFTWLSFAIVYILIMTVLLTGTKSKRKKTPGC